MIRTGVLRILNVRTNEWSLVKGLFLFEFFQGAGIAFFNTASFALFLDHFSVTELPKVFIYSAFLLWAAGFIYSRLEAHLKITTLARGITIFMAASFLLFWISARTMPPVFLYLPMAWFNVLYLLDNLQFWGMASLLFDVRQSKRLFGIISAGDIPAKFIGYSLALALVSYVGTSNLLLVGLGCMVASLPMLRRIQKMENLDQHHHPHHKVKHAAHPVSHIVKNFSSNILIRRIALTTVIASAVFIIVNYAFYAKVKEAVHSDVELAQFIALFFASARVMALLVKIVITGRLINKLGIINSLLITPILLLILAGAVILLERFSIVPHLLIYFFGAMAIMVDILKSTINTPVFLTLMQPLGTHERLRAHTITKGIMDPFAFLGSGIVLFALFRVEHNLHIPVLNYFLITLGVLWIIGIYRIHQQYLQTLLKTIGNQFLSNTDFPLSDSTTLRWLQEKLSSGSETEALNILGLLAARHSTMDEEIVLSALDNPSTSVKTRAIQLAEHWHIRHSEEALREIIRTTTDGVLKAEAIKALCQAQLNENEILPYIDDPDAVVQEAALFGILKYGHSDAAKKAKDYLGYMLYSQDSNTRKKVALLLQDLHDQPYQNEIKQLMQDPDPGVVQEAFMAAGKNGDLSLLRLMLDQFNQHEKAVINALGVAGDNALHLLESYIQTHKCTHRQKEAFIRLIGRIGGERSHKILLHLLMQMPDYFHLLIKTLYQCNYKVTLAHHHYFEAHIHNYLAYGARTLYMQKLLIPYAHKYQVLNNSLKLELDILRDTLLYLFALMYDRNKIKDVRMAFRSGRKEAIANAMEILEMTVKNQTASHFNTIFEATDIEHRTYALRKLYPSSFFANIENVLYVILDQDQLNYNDWTKACSIYTSKKQQLSIDHKILYKYLEAEHPLLSEVARFAV